MALSWLGVAAAARADVSVAASARAAGDDQGYRWNRYQLAIRHEDDASDEHLLLNWHTYSLNDNLGGILPFDGSEPSVELGGHVLYDLWWFAGSLGFQGTADLEGAIGNAVIARAIPAGSSTFTPKLEVAREALADTALPLSLGLTRERGEALLGWRAPNVVAEGGARVELWESDTISGRTSNPARDHIDGTRVTIAHAYVLSDWASWFNFGLAAKTAWSSDNTLLATQTLPVYRYNWYPASAPPFAWETALVLRASGHIVPELEALLQLQLPMVSQETRQWESLRRTYLGTAPFEAKLEMRWSIFRTTALRAAANVFAKPWQHWDVFGPGAYRMLAVEGTIEQHF